MITVYGDSISHGGADGGWPIRIRRMLWRAGLGDGVYVQAVPGHTSGDLVRRMPVELPLRPTPVVVIAIGTNDAQRLLDDDHPRMTDDEFKENLSGCVRMAKQHARWVVLLSPYGLGCASGEPSLRHITGERLAGIGDVVRTVAKDHACWHIDVSSVLQAEHFFSDGVHPLPAGHDVLAERIWEGLRLTGCLGWPDEVPSWCSSPP